MLTLISTVLTIIAPMVARGMKWLGFSDDQQVKWLNFVNRVQAQAGEGANLADDEKLAEEKLKARIDQENAKPLSSNPPESLL